MREAYDVIVAPVVTEKTTEQMEASLYTFIVNERANKHEIARAVEALWDVKVTGVRTMRYPGEGQACAARPDGEELGAGPHFVLQEGGGATGPG